MERLESALGLASDHATKLTDLVRQVNLYDKSLPPSERAFLQKCLADKGMYLSDLLPCHSHSHLNSGLRANVPSP